MEEGKKPQPNLLQTMQAIELALEEHRREQAREWQKLREAAGWLADEAGRIEVGISDEAKKIYDGMARGAGQSGRLQRLTLASLGAALFITAVSLSGAAYFYKSSVRAKSELREEIVREIAVENRERGRILVGGQEHRILQNEYGFLKGWVRANPRDSRKLRERREAYFNATRKAHDANFSSDMR